MSTAARRPDHDALVAAAREQWRAAKRATCRTPVLSDARDAAKAREHAAWQAFAQAAGARAEAHRAEAREASARACSEVG